MAQPRNKAVIAGLAAALTLGGVTLPAVATTSNTTASDSDPNGMGTPLPSDYDKSDYYEGTEGTSTFASARSASTLSPVSLTDEMKYFTLYESGRNYDKGLSRGDGYNAVGYYQFDRRYALVPFLRQVYAYNPQTYGMFAPVLAQASTLASGSYSMYDYNTRQLTALAQQLNEAWHAAYAANPAEFSALQDSYAYNNYYLPVQSTLLNTYGVDLRNRADCVKGLAWSMCNLFGQGGVQKFFKGANLSNNMTDRELVTALCDTVINRVAEWYPSQPQYHAGWQNRFRKEKAQCLKYIEQHEAEQNAGGQPGDAPSVSGPSVGDAPSANGPSAGDAPSANDQGFGSTGGAPGADAPNVNDGAAGGATNQPAVPPAANDSGSSGAPNSTPDADAGSSDGAAGGGNVESSPSGGANAGFGSSQGGEASSGSGAAGGSSSAGSTTGGSSASGGTSGGAGSSAGQGASGGSSSGAQGSGAAGGSLGDEGANANGFSSGAGAADDGSTTGDKHAGDDEKPTGDDKQTTDTASTQPQKGASSDTGAKKAAKTTSNAQGSAAKMTPAGDLPLTGDDAALVVTGAAGLAVAGASFLSLAKKENASE